MQIQTFRLTFFALVGAAFACGGGSSGPSAVAPAAAPAPAPDSAEQPATAELPDVGAQVAQGSSLYAEYCADCHGDSGQGVRKSPAVIGKGTLSLDPPRGAKRSVQLHTAADLIAYLRATMPADDPGSMSDSEYAAVSAFLVDANGIDLRGVALDEVSAPALVLHP